MMPTEQELTVLAKSVAAFKASDYASQAVDQRYVLALGYLTMKAQRDAEKEEKRAFMSMFLQMKAERDALKERLDQAREALQEFVEWHGGAHEEDCPGDDTCDCAGRASNAKANAVLREVEP